MSLRRILALGVIALAVTACDDDDPTAFSRGPRAFVRVINIMPDSGAIDFRYIDQVENTTGYGLAFGQASLYDNVEAGTRQIRVFRSSTNQAIATQVVVEGQQTFEAGKYYTILLGGRREGNAGTMTLVDDDTTAVPARAAGKFALRAYNLSGSAKDVYYRYGPLTGVNATALPGTALPPVPLPNDQASQWVSVDTARIAVAASAGPPPVEASGGMRLAVFTPGTTTGPLADVFITQGTPGTTSVNPNPGTRTQGTAITAFILPAPSAGTAGTSTTPRITFLIDREANRTAP
jgi:hypothetical protein